MSMTGKTAVVTGGARGIGRAYAERLAADGAHVVVIDRGAEDELVAGLNGRGHKLALACDVGDPEEIRRAAAAVLARFGRCDILVNNAAFMPNTGLEAITSEVWRQVQAVNVEALVHFAQAFVPGMAEAGWGRIVATGSSVTLHPQTRNLAYIVSKAGVHGLVRALANELGDRGITVNAVAPTVVPTQGFADSLPPGGPSPDAAIAMIVSQQTIKRACHPKDCADLMAFLVSDEAGFVTGQIVHVDGGRTRSGA